MQFPIIDIYHQLEGYITKHFLENMRYQGKSDHTDLESLNLHLSDELELSIQKISDYLTKKTKNIQHEDDFKLLWSNALEYISKNGIIYTEIIFTPQRYSIPVLDQLSIISQEINKYKHIQVKILVKFIGNLGVNSAQKLYNEIKENLTFDYRSFLGGFSFEGDVTASHLNSFSDLFRQIHEDSFYTAAEAHQNIWDYIFSLQIDRIVYGGSIFHNEDLLKHFRVTQSPICLSASFLDLKSLQITDNKHLYLELFENSTNVSLVTDYHTLLPSYMNVPEKLFEIGFTSEDLQEIFILNPINASFLSSFEKGSLKEKSFHFL